MIDARDSVALGRWGAEAPGWVIVSADADESEIRATVEQLTGIIFEPVGEAKRQKNRVHLDFRTGNSKRR